MRVLVFDFGAGNLHSLEKALRREGADVEVTADPRSLLDGSPLVFPGVGAFDAAAERLAPARDDIRRALLGGAPCLGICLGMQLLFERSEEGERPGLGVIPGRCVRIRARRVPHMGWNTLDVVAADPLFDGLAEPCMYFANGYVAAPEDDAAVTATCSYERGNLVAAVRQGALRGVQFHPEKSGEQGLRLLRNFLSLAARAAPAGGPATAGAVGSGS
ncbi:MAG TPA: imidazole glycerol phosphate synthase subunit HisH [Longimicrobiales bacterium]|nr:imidazole glycerol phosphate synthase subunit HisH [Longimicrobiales bacterium]